MSKITNSIVITNGDKIITIGMNREAKSLYSVLLLTPTENKSTIVHSREAAIKEIRRLRKLYHIKK